MQEKAYKLLAIQEKISNNEAKALIDAGLVSAHGKKLSVAREMMSEKTIFSVAKMEKPKLIYEDENIIAVDKPAFLECENLEKIYRATLLNRLDKGTSGVIMLAKNEEFRQKAINEFKAMRVKKTYLALVNGIVSEEIKITDPILTIKGKSGAISKISPNGKEAITNVFPLMVSGKKSFVKITIETGRTHQIRVHLASLAHGIIGDEKYAKSKSKRMFLHSYQTEILGLKFSAPLKGEFNEFGFDIPKNMQY
ncbi:RluA family pseudouridine synthase [Campylobacter sp. JMF_06 NA1]|uniref:RluA family pseudouridine synthase n=1 Tax=Campylobacter sp. JMF_06 NA1 TaxID=2983823 RepID=UPI0022E9F456|nr:RluA family pseudouridine synthase [Campylobacter sp. JMF_06 NA1]MDA3078027.1 RluA family pseudouridine synthase [Campylobacter sp. JMF_06 NA1]